MKCDLCEYFVDVHVCKWDDNLEEYRQTKKKKRDNKEKKKRKENDKIKKKRRGKVVYETDDLFENTFNFVFEI